MYSCLCDVHCLQVPVAHLYEDNIVTSTPLRTNAICVREVPYLPTSQNSSNMRRRLPLRNASDVCLLMPRRDAQWMVVV